MERMWSDDRQRRGTLNFRNAQGSLEPNRRGVGPPSTPRRTTSRRRKPRAKRFGAGRGPGMPPQLQPSDLTVSVADRLAAIAGSGMGLSRRSAAVRRHVRHREPRHGRSARRQRQRRGGESFYRPMPADVQTIGSESATNCLHRCSDGWGSSSRGRSPAVIR